MLFCCACGTCSRYYSCGFRYLVRAFVVCAEEKKQVQEQKLRGLRSSEAIWLAELMIHLTLTVSLQEDHLPSNHVLAVGTPKCRDLDLRRAPVSPTRHSNTHARASCCCCYGVVCSFAVGCSGATTAASPCPLSSLATKKTKRKGMMN